MPQIDEIDHALLTLLQKDARRTNKDLAEAVGIAQSTCLERIRSLRARGIITGYRAEVDPSALGRSIRALISVRLRPKTTTSVRAFQHDILRQAETLSVFTVSGADDFVVEVAVPDVIHLRDFILDRITNRKDVVDAHSSLVFEQIRAPVIEPLP